MVLEALALDTLLEKKQIIFQSISSVCTPSFHKFPSETISDSSDLFCGMISGRSLEQSDLAELKTADLNWTAEERFNFLLNEEILNINSAFIEQFKPIQDPEDSKVEIRQITPEDSLLFSGKMFACMVPNQNENMLYSLYLHVIHREFTGYLAGYIYRADDVLFVGLK